MPNIAPQLQPEPSSQPQLARRLGLFDATMLVMGGIIGAGIFINPYVVAQKVHTPALILGAWAAGGVIALLGAFIYAELAERLPMVGGQYAYIREAYHPLLAFLYGWVLLLVIQTGGMAAVTVTFSRYFIELTGLHLPEAAVAVLTLAILTIINCLGVRTGSTVQNTLMIMKIAAIFVLVAAGLFYIATPNIVWRPLTDRPLGLGLASDFGAAMVPVLFAIAGWQTANFAAGELKNPKKDLPRGLLLGVIGVIILYMAVNYVCLLALGATQLAQTKTPASAVMSAAFGTKGATLIAFGIAVSALGFLSQSVLTAPRVYFAMAEDGVFFQAIGRISSKTQVPVFAIILQSIWTAVILLTGKFEQILNYVVSMDFIFFGISASCIFVFRKRNVGDAQNLMPGHPWTTALFCGICALVVINTVIRYPANTLIGIAILFSGIPVFYLWKKAKSA
ncbi:MAG: amino acid/polyamine/organocation transporter, superfamily [Acidobacteriales bacterium]|nr:amino acid/polyamine/organocation transporter, superfamily [Terriglobales bacterium]